MRCIHDHDFCLTRECAFKLIIIELPVRSARTAGSVLWRVEGNIDGFTTVEDDGGEVLIEEGLDADNFFARVQEGEKGSVHAWQNKSVRKIIMAGGGGRQDHRQNIFDQ